MKRAPGKHSSNLLNWRLLGLPLLRPLHARCEAMISDLAVTARSRGPSPQDPSWTPDAATAKRGACWACPRLPLAGLRPWNPSEPESQGSRGIRRCQCGTARARNGIRRIRSNPGSRKSAGLTAPIPSWADDAALNPRRRRGPGAWPDCPASSSRCRRAGCLPPPSPAPASRSRRDEWGCRSGRDRWRG